VIGIIHLISNLEQHISMARLTNLAPTHEIMAAQEGYAGYFD